MMKRLIIRVRWVMVGVGSLAVGLGVASGWFVAITTCSFSFVGLDFQASVCCGIFSAAIAEHGLVINEPFWQVAALENGPEWKWKFAIERSASSAPKWYFAPWIHLWAVALSAFGVGFAGFRSKRRQPKPGECTECRHPLMGATTCPECGCATEGVA